MIEELENHINQNADDTPEGLFAECKEKLDALEAKMHYLETEVIEKLRAELHQFVPPTSRK